jgi:hypothetical protein
LEENDPAALAVEVAILMAQIAPPVGVTISITAKAAARLEEEGRR